MICMYMMWQCCVYQGSEKRDDEGGSEVGKGGEGEIGSIYGQQVGVFEGEELGGGEESRGA